MPDPNKRKNIPRSFLSALFHPWIWKMAWRDGRSQRSRLSVFALAIVSGVASLTAIHCIKVSVERGVEEQAKSLLGADLQISARQALPKKAISTMASKAGLISQEVSFSSMLYFPSADAAKLVQIRGMDGLYPFYGHIETKPSDAWQRMQHEKGILLEPTLLDQFGLKVGDTVKLGEKELPILGVITKPAPRGNRFIGFAPEAYLNLHELKATGLLDLSSLSFYNVYLKADPAAVKTVRDEFEKEGWRFETPESRRDSIAKALDVFQQFLGIIAMAALILGAIGVAGAIHTHLASREVTVAILRCLGCPSQGAYAIYFIQTVSLSLLGSLSGGILGIALHLALLRGFGGQLPIPINSSPEWATAAVCTAIGFIVCAAFSFFPLSRLGSITPGRALNDLVRTPHKGGGRSRWAASAFLSFVLLMLALYNVPEPKRALGMALGLTITLAALAGTAGLLIFLAKRWTQPSWPYLFRQGLANLHRPRNQTLLFLFSLGLGSFLLLLVLLSRQAVLERITLSGLKDNPNIYLVDIQNDQRDGVERLLQRLGLPVLESAPIVTMRIQSVKGVPIAGLLKQDRIPRWILQREFRSSYRSQVNKTETVIEGQWISRWDGNPGAAPVSLEKEVAKDLGVGLGDELVLDIQGTAVTAKVTSLREVDWSRFNLNFFMLFPPGILEEAPGFHVMTVRLPDNTSSGILQRELAKEFPNVSAIDLTLMLETVRSILDKVSIVVQFVVAFTLLAGLAIVGGALLNGKDQRMRESALLRALGASSRQVQTILTMEYGALGFFSGLAGTLLAVAAYVPLSIWVFQVSPWPGWILPLLTMAGATLLSIGAGRLLSRDVCRHPPLEVLRNS